MASLANVADGMRTTLDRVTVASVRVADWTLNALKTSVSILLGLLLGGVVAFLLAWYGSRAGADSIKRNVWSRAWTVQDRQQAMADEALTLAPLLKRFGALRHPEVFADVERERSELAGDASLEGKLAHEQWLEEALLRSEQVWNQSRKVPALAAYEPWREYGRVWEQQRRLLVVEERALKQSTDELNGLLGTWPMSVLLAHKTVGGLTGSILSDAWDSALLAVRIGLDWMGYGLRRLAALAGHEASPPPPTWTLKHPLKAVTLSSQPYIALLPQLVFLADAPLPEGDYNEIQFTNEVPANYADVERGEDKAVPENRNPPAAYEAPLPRPQTTVVYSAPN